MQIDNQATIKSHWRERITFKSSPNPVRVSLVDKGAFFEPPSRQKTDPTMQIESVTLYGGDENLRHCIGANDIMSTVYTTYSKYIWNLQNAPSIRDPEAVYDQNVRFDLFDNLTHQKRSNQPRRLNVNSWRIIEGMWNMHVFIQ